MTQPTLAVRVSSDNPDHHLWNNNGTWWCHFTLHLPDYTKTRVRTSLGTSSLVDARQLRDALLVLLPSWAPNNSPLVHAQPQAA